MHVIHKLMTQINYQAIILANDLLRHIAMVVNLVFVRKLTGTRVKAIFFNSIIGVFFISTKSHRQYRDLAGTEWVCKKGIILA